MTTLGGQSNLGRSGLFPGLLGGSLRDQDLDQGEAVRLIQQAARILEAAAASPSQRNDIPLREQVLLKLQQAYALVLRNAFNEVELAFLRKCLCSLRVGLQANLWSAASLSAALSL